MRSEFGVLAAQTIARFREISNLDSETVDRRTKPVSRSLELSPNSQSKDKRQEDPIFDSVTFSSRARKVKKD